MGLPNSCRTQTQTSSRVSAEVVEAVVRKKLVEVRELVEALVAEVLSHADAKEGRRTTTYYCYSYYD